MSARISYFLEGLDKNYLKIILTIDGFDLDGSGYIYPKNMPKNYPRQSIPIPLSSVGIEKVREKMDPLPLAYAKGCKIMLLNENNEVVREYQSRLIRRIHALQSPDSVAA